jgi:hypothetical protein
MDLSKDAIDLILSSSWRAKCAAEPHKSGICDWHVPAKRVVHPSKCSGGFSGSESMALYMQVEAMNGNKA